MKTRKKNLLPPIGGAEADRFNKRKAGPHKNKRDKRKNQKIEQKIWDGWQ